MDACVGNSQVACVRRLEVTSCQTMAVLSKFRSCKSRRLRAPATINNVPPSPEEAAVVFLLGEGEDLSQLTDNNDIAVFLVRSTSIPLISERMISIAFGRVVSSTNTCCSLVTFLR